MTIPIEYGGQGLSYMDAILVIEEMAKVCGVTARIVVEANMGGVGAIMKYGSDTQKKLAARLVSEGDKHWITGGGVSKLHLIFTRVIEGGNNMGIGGFIALKGSKGLTIGKREPTMGLRGIPETVVQINDLTVSEDMMLIPPEGLKRGFSGLMQAYNAQRIGAATVALGIAQGAYELALDYTKERRQFGRPIAEFQGLQWMLADMSTGLCASRALIHIAAMNAKAGFPDMQEAAQAKILASETAIKVTNDALQLHGSAGYSRNNPLERMARDARMFTIGGGTAQILRTQVAGAILGMKTPQRRDSYVDDLPIATIAKAC